MTSIIDSKNQLNPEISLTIPKLIYDKEIRVYVISQAHYTLNHSYQSPLNHTTTIKHSVKSSYYNALITVPKFTMNNDSANVCLLFCASVQYSPTIKNK